MKYTYYPGCSLEGACTNYDHSLRRVFELLGHELEELDDWNCCGATMYMSVKETVALSVSARNLALAEKHGNGPYLVAPCSACYTTLQKTNRYLRDVPEQREHVGAALAEAGLSYDLTVRVRHPLDILVNEIGVDTIARQASRRLDGLRFAPYYGCLIVRPEPAFDDQDWPTSLDDLFQALGAEAVYFPERVRCCGGMLTTTCREVGDRLTGDVLGSAARNGADVVLTTCPLCQSNLEMHRSQLGGSEGSTIPVLFFTQLLGVALGESTREMQLDRGLVSPGPRLRELAGAAR